VGTLLVNVAAFLYSDIALIATYPSILRHVSLYCRGSTV